MADCLGELGFDVDRREAPAGAEALPRVPELVLIYGELEELAGATESVEVAFGGLPPVGWVPAPGAESREPPAGVSRLELELGAGEWEVELEHAVVRLMGPFGSKPTLLGGSQGRAPAGIKAGSGQGQSTRPPGVKPRGVTDSPAEPGGESRAPRLLVLDRPGWRARSSWATESSSSSAMSWPRSTR